MTAARGALGTLLACVAVALGGAFGGGDPSQVRLSGALTALAADGTRVIAGLRRGACAVLVLWEPGGRPRELRRDCAPGAIVTFDSVALSGGSAAWTAASRRGTRVERTLSAARIGSRSGTPRVLSRAVAVERRGRRPTGDTIDSLTGDAAPGAPVFVFRKHRHTGAAHRPDDVYLVRDGAVSTLVRNAHVGLGAVDGGRVAAVFPLPERILVLGPRGETTASVDVDPEAIPVGAELRGQWLVIVSGRRGADAEAASPFTADSRSLDGGTPSGPWSVDGLPVEIESDFAAFRLDGRLVRRDLERGETATLLDAVGPSIRFAAVERGVVTGSTRLEGGRATTMLEFLAAD